jgi:octanoyl-[GcvH]:protein N-octanoyltransferase
MNSDSSDHAPKPPLRLIDASHAGRADLGTAISSALMRRVARGELEPTMRLHRTGPILAFGRLDRLRPGYRRAVEIAREHGYEPIERLAGGRAAVFHEGSISFSRATREPGANAGTRARFVAMAETIAEALEALGLDARVGEVAGEYCPGEYSVNARGAVKLAGIGQRVITAGAHIGGVIVVRGAGRIRDVLEPVYEALETAWDPATTGSVAAELGEDDATVRADEADPLVERVIDAVRAVLARDFELVDAELDEGTVRLAEELRPQHTAPRGA